MKRILIATAALAMIGTAASAATLDTAPSKIGDVVTAGDSGLTLYTFRKDAENASNCYDGCAAKWPPFIAAASDVAEGDLGIIERKDGTRQFTLNGQPLYFWVGDRKAGDVTGDGVGGVWDAVRQ